MGGYFDIGSAERARIGSLLAAIPASKNHKHEITNIKSLTCNHKHEIKNQNWDAVGISGTYWEAVGRSGTQWESSFPRYRIFVHMKARIKNLQFAI